MDGRASHTYQTSHSLQSVNTTHRTYAALTGNPRAYSSGHKRGVCFQDMEDVSYRSHVSKFGKTNQTSPTQSAAI